MKRRSVSGPGSAREGVSRVNYNVLMARGWESKSIEAQQAEATEQSSKARAPRLSPEEAAQFRERESLRLARKRLLQQIESSHNERHRKLLQQSLAAVEYKLGKLPG